MAQLQIPPNDDLETYRKLQKDPPQNFSTDLKCQIIPTILEDDHSAYEYYTQDGLLKALVYQLETTQGGRTSRHELARRLQVDEAYLQGDESPLIRMLPASVQVLGSDEFVCQSYWKQLQADIEKQVQEQGTLQLLDVSSQHSVPMETLFAKCCISDMDQTSLIGDSNSVLVSNTFLQELKATVMETFQNLKEPTSVSTICQERGWDLGLVVGWLLSETAGLEGEVRVDASSTTTAMFLPNVYTQTQHQEILDFVSSNGYMTAERATRQGMPMSQMTDLVQKSFPDAIVLGDVLILDHVLQNIQVVIQELATTGSIDLQEYLDAELIRSDILQTLLNRAGFTDDHGVAVLVDDQALLVSRDLIQGIFVKTLPPLMQRFSKQRADQIFNSAPSTTSLEGEEEAPAVSRKGKSSKSRKSKNSRTKKSSDEAIAAGVIPLLQVAGAVLKDYPNFMNETVEQDLLDQADSLSWEDEEASGILLVEFCRTALYTDDFRSKCDKAVSAELQNLQSAKQSKATLSRKDAASKVRSVEAAFEDSFVTSCYMIQAVAKFIGLASSSDKFDETSLEALRTEFLQGCCADLTSRVTQYSLFQNEEDMIFTFRHPDEPVLVVEEESKDQSSSLPACCFTVDPTTRRFPKAYLSCPPPRDPLPILRESLSGNSGVTLARQWILCGGECYLGGIRKSDEDESEFIRPGNMDGFLSHVEENCLYVR
jgi:hypothetical protein